MLSDFHFLCCYPFKTLSCLPLISIVNSKFITKKKEEKGRDERGKAENISSPRPDVFPTY